MSKALDQARDARLHILGERNKVIAAPREEMSEWAPTIMSFKIDPEKIRDVIGKGGAVIRAMTEETGATIDIEQDGTVRIASIDSASTMLCARRVWSLRSPSLECSAHEWKIGGGTPSNC